MAKKLKGYKSFSIGPIANDGGMGTVLTALGTTVKGNTNANTSEATTQDFFIEEQTQAFDSTVTADPQMSGVLEIYDIDPDTAVKVLPGTVTSTGTGATKRKVFTPATPYVPIEVSGEIESKNGTRLSVARMQLLSVLTFPFSDTELGKIVINWKALAPDKLATPAYSFSVPDPA
jgi:hypothetical protein